MMEHTGMTNKAFRGSYFERHLEEAATSQTREKKPQEIYPHQVCGARQQLKSTKMNTPSVKNKDRTANQGPEASIGAYKKGV